MTAESENPSSPDLAGLWSALIVEELLRCGVRLFCLSPGSRNTPMVTAIASRAGESACLHFDERGAAFYALGHARATGEPAAVVATSGTAVANYLPAVVEAANDRVPLLLLTADRPPELRDCGANQAIRQPGIFGNYVRWDADLPCATTEIAPAYVLTTIDQAVYRSRRGPAGPVHVNAMFREPLTPAGALGDYELPASLAAWAAGDEPFTRYSDTTPRAAAEDLAAAAETVNAAKRGIVLVGRLSRWADADAAVALAEALGWPLLPDITSGLRLGRGGGPELAYAHLLLGQPSLASAVAPQAVLHLGGAFTSKRLLQRFAKVPPAAYLHVTDDPLRQDPGHYVTHRLESAVDQFCADLGPLLRPREDADAWGGLRDANARVDAGLGEALRAEDALSEPLVARLLSQSIPAGHGLFLGNSMPIRDMDTFADPSGARAAVAANRGASGIDGTVATASGFAAGLDCPCTAVVGDVAMLHDLNSLALAAAANLILVVVNNDGCGIFSFLPIAAHERDFETYFGTPHGFSFARAAAMFDLAYHAPRTGSEFLEAHRAVRASGAGALIEVRTDRNENWRWHRELEDRVGRALEDMQ